VLASVLALALADSAGVDSLAPPPVPVPVIEAAAADSARLGFEAGLSADYSNEIAYEETFDSTAVTGRKLAQDARSRAVGFVVARAAAAHGRLSWNAVNDAGIGPTVRREAFDTWGAERLGDRLSLRLDGAFDARKDGTFDDVREDHRAAGGASLRWTAEDLSSGARLFGRVEALRSAPGTLTLFPDYDFRQAGLELDRFGLRGHGALTYAYGARAFPDTARRDYREHDLGWDFGVWSSARWRLEGRGDAERRVAWRDSAVGDRFFSGDGQLALWFTPSPRFEWGPVARLRAQSFDAPDPTFYDVSIYRYGIAARLLPDAYRRWEVRPEIELLRTPRFGGLSDTASVFDRAAVAGEEYDQLSLTLENESLAPRRFRWVTLEAGHRQYADDADGATSLSVRSSFWYGDLSGYAERPLAGPVRLRLTVDLRAEWHRVPADDLRSVDLGLELRTPL